MTPTRKVPRIVFFYDLRLRGCSALMIFDLCMN